MARASRAVVGRERVWPAAVCYRIGGPALENQLLTDGSVEQCQGMSKEKQLREGLVSACGGYATGERIVPSFWLGGRPHGSNRQKRRPKPSAISIGLRSRTLATIAERISHSHPALTVAGATRIQHHCGTCGDRDATGFFCFALPAHMSRPIPHRSSQFSRPAFFCHSFFLGTASG
jgi:hypothetical protein